jgi:hypothetical protein
MYRQLAETGGVPNETEMQIKMDGEGPTAEMISKMCGMTMTTSVQSVESGALAEDLFTPPAGHKLNARQ